MTRTTNARIAGIAFLAYIAVGIAALVVFGRAARGDGVGARIASIAQHTTEVGVVVLLALLACFAALVLAVTIHALTRDEDADLALFALVCRVIEAVPGFTGTLGLLWLATSPAAQSLDAGAAHALAAFLLRGEGGAGAIFFAVASTVYSWLFLRGGMIPAWLARLGIVASALLVFVLPLQLAGLMGGPMAWTSAIAWIVWLPMLVYELVLAVWLIVRGAAIRSASAKSR
ncbi:MAG TPA: DUF4386 domain-containing protein [Tahibacter sp.]|nr:DUF4386 domain-containing protein [Tahibacter sp.]